MLSHYYTAERQILGNQIRFSHIVTYHSNAINSIYRTAGPSLCDITDWATPSCCLVQVHSYRNKDTLI